MTRWDFQVAFWKARYLKLLLLRELRKTFEGVAIEGERISECVFLEMLENPKLLFFSLPTCQRVWFFSSIAKENITCYFCGLFLNQDGSSEKGKEDVLPLYVYLLSCGKN